MVSFGLSLAEGKRVYDAEKQRRAEAEEYKKDAALRAARRRIGLAQATMAETQARTEVQKGKEFLSADAKETRKVQQSVDKLKAKTEEILQELGPERAKQVTDAFRIVSKYKDRIQSDPQAVADALNEQGFDGFTLVADPDGWANGIKLRTADGSREITFANPDQALLALHRYPVDAALAHAQSIEASNVKQQEKWQNYRMELAKINAKTQGDLLVAEANQAKDPKKLIEGFDTLAQLDAGMVRDKVTGAFIDAVSGEGATAEQYDLYQKSFKDSVAAAASSSPVRTGLYSAVKAESDRHLAEITQLREDKMLEQENFKRAASKDLLPPKGSSIGLPDASTATDQSRNTRTNYPAFQGLRPMSTQEQNELERDIQRQYPYGTPVIHRGLGQITQ